MRVLASRLQNLRLPRGAQQTLAELAGLNPRSIIRWRKGEGNPRLSELEALADAMEVSVVYLVSAESREEPKLPEPGHGAVSASQRVERLLRRAERLTRELTAATAAARSEKKP